MADSKEERIGQVEHYGALDPEKETGSGPDSVKGAIGGPDGAVAGQPAVATGRRGPEPPEFLRNMSMEQRLELEAKLMRKIDLRLMPCIILMYILNYIDR